MVRYTVKVVAWALKMAAIGISAMLVVLSYKDVLARQTASEEAATEAAEEAPKIEIERNAVAGAGIYILFEEPVKSEETVDNVEPVKTEQIVGMIPEPVFTESEEKALLKVAMAEAEGESIEGKALVMRVVLNRKEDPAFPNSIEDVVMQQGQFSTVANGRYSAADPDDGCEEALELIISGWDESKGAEYFESCKYDSWQSGNRSFLFQNGGHKFYK